MKDNEEENLLINYVYHNIIFINFFNDSVKIFSKLECKIPKKNQYFQNFLLRTMRV